MWPFGAAKPPSRPRSLRSSERRMKNVKAHIKAASPPKNILHKVRSWGEYLSGNTGAGFAAGAAALAVITNATLPARIADPLREAIDTRIGVPALAAGKDFLPPILARVAGRGLLAAKNAYAGRAGTSGVTFLAQRAGTAMLTLFGGLGPAGVIATSMAAGGILGAAVHRWWSSTLEKRADEFNAAMVTLAVGYYELMNGLEGAFIGIEKRRLAYRLYLEQCNVIREKAIAGMTPTQQAMIAAPLNQAVPGMVCNIGNAAQFKRFARKLSESPAIGLAKKRRTIPEYRDRLAYIDSYGIPRVRAGIVFTGSHSASRYRRDFPTLAQRNAYAAGRKTQSYTDMGSVDRQHFLELYSPKAGAVARSRGRLERAGRYMFPQYFRKSV